MELICQMIKKKLTTCECRVKVYLAVSVKKEIKRLQFIEEHFKYISNESTNADAVKKLSYIFKNI